jgi:hypothetical protein
MFSLLPGLDESGHSQASSSQEKIVQGAEPFLAAISHSFTETTISGGTL